MVPKGKKQDETPQQAEKRYKKTQAEKKKKTTKKKKAASSSQKSWLSQHWIEALLSLASLVIIVVLVVLFIQKIFQEAPIVRYLPAESTVGFVTIESDSTSNEIQQIQKHINSVITKPLTPSENPETGTGEILEEVGEEDSMELETTTGTGSILSGTGSIIMAQSVPLWLDRYRNEMEPWIGKKIGIALVEGNETRSYILFIPVQDQEGFSAYSQQWKTGDTLEEQYEGTTIFSLQKPIKSFGARVQRYFVLSQDKATLQRIVDVHRGKVESLHTNDNWTQIQKNLPTSSFVTLYINYKKVIEPIKERFDETKLQRDIFMLLKPLEKNIFSLGMSVSWMENQQKTGWQSKLVAYGSEPFFQSMTPLRDKESITSPVSFSSTGYIAGTDMLQTMRTAIERFGQSAPDSEIILEGLLNYTLQKYIAQEMLFSDMVENLPGDAEITFMPMGDEQNGIVARWQTNNQPQIAAFLEDTFANFSENSELLYSPEIREFTLPDGTVGKEIYLAPRDISVQEKELNGHQAHHIAIEKDLFSPGYLITNEHVYIFSHIGLMERFFENKTSQLFAKEATLLKNKSHVRGFVKVSELLQMDNAIVHMLQELFDTYVFSIDFYERGLIVEQFLSMK